MTDGTIERHGEELTFRYERLLARPLDVVWRAVTDPAEIERWSGTGTELDLRPGGLLVSQHKGGHRVVDRVLRVEPPRLFEHTYFEDVNPSAVVTWRIDAAPTGALLVLTHRLRMDDIRAAAATIAAGDDLTTILSRNAAGWHHILDLIESRLSGETLDWSPRDQEALRQRYATLVG
ncbi:SRPBCC domain-containing protein [Microtetraspora niveoalba]|uniref:SRPBCC domain-containing protein n=1 Tax=Microtetraspora niveoalba TaxID=46175 RepID=UPI000835F066|nr:SRPBCC domain-containing protein [Microtetraspora niveoalba]